MLEHPTWVGDAVVGIYVGT